MNICVIGGDSRIVELVKMLHEDGNNLLLYGLEKSVQLSKAQSEGYRHAHNLQQALQKTDFVITSIPLTKDGVTVNAVYTEKNILVEDVFKMLNNVKIITGNITEKIMEYVKPENNVELIDVLKLEELTVLNAIPTAEGAIQIAMEKSPITLHGSNCLVLGFGRIGKILSKMLMGIGANVYCEARKQSDIAWIKSYGYKAIELDELNDYLGSCDFIFNTIPHLILDETRLKLIKKQCILIDLASKPGGIDFEKSREIGIDTEWALALPGKVAPRTSANYIYEIIKKLKFN